jgi:hypothetical protein
MILEESDIAFDFRNALSGTKFDDQNHGLSHCMKAVDLIIETTDKVLFIEVKDPQRPQAQQKDREKFLDELKSEKLINENLVVKGRDSFLYRFAAGEVSRIKKPIHYYVLIAQDTLDSAMLIQLTDKLRKAIPTSGPNNKRWQSPFIEECAVFNLKTWNINLRHMTVRRKSDTIINR